MFNKRDGFYILIKSRAISEDLWNSISGCIGMCVNQSLQVFDF